MNNGLEDWPAADGPQAPRRHDTGTGKWATEPDQFVVVTVCRLVRYKGVFMFLEAAELSRTPRGVFLVAGEGECRAEIEDWITQRGQGGRIRLLGHVHDIDALYRRADLMVLCSRAEGQPYVLLEAMRAKCAILATDVPGNAGLIDHGKSGCLVGGNARDVARTIDHLLAHPEIRAAHAARAHAAFRDHHLLESQVSRLLGTYAEYMRDRMR